MRTDHDEEIARLRRAGVSRLLIQKQLGVKHWDVERVIKAKGLAVQKRVTMSRELEGLIAQALKEGMTVAAAALTVGVSNRTVDRFKLRVASGTMPPEKKRSSFWLTPPEREDIARFIDRGFTDSQIARHIGRHRSSVGREIKRNGGRKHYSFCKAERLAQASMARPKPFRLLENNELRVKVEEYLENKYLSPQQIVHELTVDYPDDQEMRVSHETIYQSLYVQSRGVFRKELTTYLRTGRTRRKQQGVVSGKGRIIGMINISQRPAEVEDRAVPGHWEGDLIVGPSGSTAAIATLVERHTRFVMLVPVPDKQTETVCAALAAKILELPIELRRSLTWDQGKELANHKDFKIKTGVDVYFCDPHSPWQRGSNENTNGLLRQFFPKGSELAGTTQTRCDEVAALLNIRPRQTLGWMKPCESFNELLQ